MKTEKGFDGRMIRWTDNTCRGNVGSSGSHAVTLTDNNAVAKVDSALLPPLRQIFRLLPKFPSCLLPQGPFPLSTGQIKLLDSSLLGCVYFPHNLLQITRVLHGSQWASLCLIHNPVWISIWFLQLLLPADGHPGSHWALMTLHTTFTVSNIFVFLYYLYFFSLRVRGCPL